MSTESHYDQWSAQYDTNVNKTRDLEAMCIRQLLGGMRFEHVLEMGAGTGKNTVWLAERTAALLAVDLSREMLAKAKEKVVAQGLDAHCDVQFLQADLTQPWKVGRAEFDLVSFSLVLEHIADLEPVFAEAAQALVPGGHVYVGEFHPFRQYMGKKARYETAEGEVELQCFNHHVTDFVNAAAAHGLQLVRLEEFFDDGDRSLVPRVLGMLFRR
jgi:ubiquinone/menaquinone biosynthesis C-methylase UbiE